jgi:hypothetical protein
VMMEEVMNMRILILLESILAVFQLGGCCSKGHLSHQVDFKELDTALYAMIADKNTSVNDLSEAISRLRTVKEPPAFWRNLSNKSAYSSGQRVRFILALFKRHAEKCTCTVQLAEVLGKPDWLKEANIEEITAMTGNIPVTFGFPPDSTVFKIQVSDFDNGHLYVYIKVLGKCKIFTFYKGLTGDEKSNSIILEYGYDGRALR